MKKASCSVCRRTAPCAILTPVKSTTSSAAHSSYAPPAVYRCQLHPNLDPDNYSKHKTWTSSGVSRILQDVVYLGQIAQGKTDKISFKSKKTREKRAEDWIIVADQHEPLVSRQTFDAVQRLVAQLYEDRLAGKIGETNFYPLLERYEQKTAELQRQIGAMETGDSADDLRAQQERLRAVIRRYQDIDELTPSLLFELIERIEVGQGTYEKTAEGKVKRQRISIQFRFLPEPCEFDWTE